MYDMNLYTYFHYPRWSMNKEWQMNTLRRRVLTVKLVRRVDSFTPRFQFSFPFIRSSHTGDKDQCAFVWIIETIYLAHLSRRVFVLMVLISWFLTTCKLKPLHTGLFSTDQRSVFPTDWFIHLFIDSFIYPHPNLLSFGPSHSCIHSSPILIFTQASLPSFLHLLPKFAC